MVTCPTVWCQMLKENFENTRNKLEEVKTNIRKLKEIGYFNARNTLAKFFKKLPNRSLKSYDQKLFLSYGT